MFRAAAFDLYDYGLPPPSARHERHDGEAGDDLRDWIVTDDFTTATQIGGTTVNRRTNPGIPSALIGGSWDMSDPVQKITFAEMRAA